MLKSIGNPESQLEKKFISSTYKYTISFWKSLIFRTWKKKKKIKDKKKGLRERKWNFEATSILSRKRPVVVEYRKYKNFRPKNH